MARPAPTPTVLDAGLIIPAETIGLDVEAFDNVIRGKGVPCIHYRALKCPLGMIDPNDIRAPHDISHNCSNGFIYKPVGRVTTTFSSNSTDIKRLGEMGLADGSTVLATFPRFMDSDPNKRVVVLPYDRIYFEQEDLLSGTWELAQRRLDTNNDRLEFPVIQVETLLDANNVEYHQHVDFDLTFNGDIAWRATKGPAKGVVYSVWYLHRPFYYVDRLVHDLRLFPTHGYLEPDKIEIQRLGSSAVLQREYVHRTQSPDSGVPANQRGRQKLPPDSNEYDTV